MPISPRIAEDLMRLGRRSLDKPSMQNVLDAALVTGCDKSHFKEIQDAIASVQNFFPEKKIIFYDLGLTISQKIKVSTAQVIISSSHFISY